MTGPRPGASSFMFEEVPVAGKYALHRPSMPIIFSWKMHTLHSRCSLDILVSPWITVFFRMNQPVSPVDKQRIGYRVSFLSSFVLSFKFYFFRIVAVWIALENERTRSLSLTISALDLTWKTVASNTQVLSIPILHSRTMIVTVSRTWTEFGSSFPRGERCIWMCVSRSTWAEIILKRLRVWNFSFSRCRA